MTIHSSVRPVRSFKTIQTAGVSTLALMMAAASISPAYAAITNTATATGTYNASPTTSAPDSESVPVQGAGPVLSVTKTVLAPATILFGPQATLTDANDVIVYQYVVQNDGNVTISNVGPLDGGVNFGPLDLAGTGSLSGFTLVSTTGTGVTGLGNLATLDPGESATFTASYTLSALDVYRSAAFASPDGVTNSATATGTPITGTLATVTASIANTTIAAGPRLSIVKSYTYTSGAAPADAGEVITYTYLVTNIGNVALSNVVINDVHEGASVLQANIDEDAGSLVEGPLLAADSVASTDAAVDGSWDVLQPGSSVEFNYVHTVTQTEVNNQ
jgi:hypothetical protein